MKRGEKQLLYVVVGLILLNCLTVAFFLNKDEGTGGSSEVVATVGKEEITRQDLVHILEEKYGKNVLKDLIDQEVIKTLAKEYKVEISKEAIDREILLIKTMYGAAAHGSSSETEWRGQIESTLLLEEILTKDVTIPEEELKAYYEENSSLFQIPTSYHVSHLVVKTMEDAVQALEELEQGSSFAALAMEKSIDELSAIHGGELGFVHEGEPHFSSEYIETVEGLKPGEWSEPVRVEEGYALLMLHEVIEGKSYPFKEMKNEIRRLIALEQMEGHSTIESYWDEVNVEWLYGENSTD